MARSVGRWVVTLVVVSFTVGIAIGAGGGAVPATQSVAGASGDSVEALRSATGLSPSSQFPAHEAANFSIPAPDHGVDPAVFPRLWSGDIDEVGNAAEGSGRDVLLSVADYPFARPPAAVQTWTAGEHDDFPRTDTNRSVYPSHATLTDRRWIKDAYIQVFAVQPSTVAHVATGGDTRHYIRSSGDVLATTDYRIGLPPDEDVSYTPADPKPGETVLLRKVVTWELIDHKMGPITLEAGGDPVGMTGPTQTPRLAYSSLPASTDHLSVSVTISATVQKTTRRQYKSAIGDCGTPTTASPTDPQSPEECEVTYETYWTTDVAQPRSEVRVRDSIPVTIYELAPAASRAEFLDGRTALAVDQNEGDPWAMYDLQGGGSVHNLWHFYSARNAHWDTLVESSANGTTHQRSHAIPLQVHAFPSAGGVYAESAFGSLEVTETWGPHRRAPSLPAHITLPVVENSYTTGSVVVVEGDGSLLERNSVIVRGLVRGVEATVPIRETREQREVALDLELVNLNRSAGTVTVRVTIRDAGTREPLDIRSRPGTVEVQGVAVEPDASGTAVVTVPLAGNVVTARYAPGPWWATDPAYAPARASVTLPTGWPDPLQVVVAGFTLLLWLTPLLLGIYVIDRLLGKGRLWPPWRGLE